MGEYELIETRAQFLLGSPINQVLDGLRWLWYDDVLESIKVNLISTWQACLNDGTQ